MILGGEVGSNLENQQALSEAARTTEEDELATSVGELKNDICLVHVDITISADTLEVLYANRIKHFSFFCLNTDKFKVFFSETGIIKWDLSCFTWMSHSQ
jgi:hypothetical protein